MNELQHLAIICEDRQGVATAEISREAEQVGGGWMTFGGKNSWANQACGLGMQEPVSDDDLDRFVDFYVSRGVEPRIEVCSYADKALLTGLAKRAFQLQEFENVFARRMQPNEDLRATHPHGWPDNLEIFPVDPTNQRLVETYVEVSSSGFRKEGEPVTPQMSELIINSLQHEKTKAFLASLNGEVVGAGGMEAVPPTACLCGASVLKEARRQGIQTALVIRRLEHARDTGCQWGTITSQPGIPTERNAQRLGFFLAYSKVVMVMPGPELEPSP